MQYIRQRESQYGPESVAAPEGIVEQGAGASNTVAEKGEGVAGQEADKKTPGAQKVCVLRGGFSRWQEAHGPDERLTEAYVKDLWEDY